MKRKLSYLNVWQVLLLYLLLIGFIILTNALLYLCLTHADLSGSFYSSPLFHFLDFIMYCLPLLAVIFIGLRIFQNGSIANGREEFRKINIYIIATCVIIAYGIVYFIRPFESLILLPHEYHLKDWDLNVFVVLSNIIAAPILEELLFRGIFLKGLLEKYNPAFAIIFSSILFAVLHIYPWHIVLMLFVGLLQGWLYYRTRSLPMCIILHSLYNFGLYFLKTDLVYHQSYLIFSFILVCLVLGFGIWLLSRLFNKYYPEKRVTVFSS
jgi:uncharacterized protein